MIRYAVVFKTYSWDAFNQRQAERCQKATGPNGDFFISVDQTNGDVGPTPFDRVVRTSNSQLTALGFANRFEQGSLIWWNADYPHYQFQEMYPDYDYYVFVEYDAIIQGNLDPMIEKVAAAKADYVALPIDSSIKNYYWTLPHLQTYKEEEIRAALMCVSIYSPRALRMLAARRKEMAVGDKTKYWPMAEMYLAIEISRNGYNFLPIDEIGSTKGYTWFPPKLEDDVIETSGPAFIHPVLDKNRYIKSIINNNTHFRSFLYWRSTMYRTLRRFPFQDYSSLIVPAAKRRFQTSMKLKSTRALLLLRSKFGLKA